MDMYVCMCFFRLEYRILCGIRRTKRSEVFECVWLWQIKIFINNANICFRCVYLFFHRLCTRYHLDGVRRESNSLLWSVFAALWWQTSMLFRGNKAHAAKYITWRQNPTAVLIRAPRRPIKSMWDETVIQFQVKTILFFFPQIKVFFGSEKCIRK